MNLNTITCEELGDEDKTWRYLSDKIVSGTWENFAALFTNDCGKGIIYRKSGCFIEIAVDGCQDSYF